MTGKYSSPSSDLLRDPIQRLANNSEDVRKMDALHAVFDLMGFSAEVKRIVHGPQATQFAICIADGINVNKLASKQDQIAAVMGVDKIYIQIPIPGTSLIGIEVPNSQRDTIYLKDLLLDDTYQSSSSPTNICIGKTLPEEPIYCEITDLPHVLVAGKRDSGKSTFLRSVILNLLFRASPEQVRLLLIDPTDKEFEAYKLLPHLAAPVITDAQKGIAALAWVIKEMSWRYQLFQQAMVRNISGYNRKMDDPIKALPFLIVIISELGLLMEADRKRTEAAIQRLAALGRAAGIHLFYARGWLLFRHFRFLGWNCFIVSWIHSGGLAFCCCLMEGGNGSCRLIRQNKNSHRSGFLFWFICRLFGIVFCLLIRGVGLIWLRELHRLVRRII